MKTWLADTYHSFVQFTIPHMMIANVKGFFQEFSGKMIVNSPTDFSDAQIEGEIAVKSIYTTIPARDEHLISEDFFDAERYPKITFKTLSMLKITEKLYIAKGEITIKAITKPINLEMNYMGKQADMEGKPRMGFELSGKIKRTDFGLVWNKLLENGAFLIGNDLSFVVNTELVLGE